MGCRKSLFGERMGKTNILLLVMLILLCQNICIEGKSFAIVDSQYQFKEALGDASAIPLEIHKNLRLVDVTYYSFDDRLHVGQIVIHKDLVGDIVDLFQLIKKIQFPIKRAVPVVYYNGSDNLSMANNNTSGFNFRTIEGSIKMSAHAWGRAIDINPFNNPMIKKNEIQPKGASYRPGKPGTLTADSPIVIALKKMGWTWGGDWRSIKDYQHFEKKGNAQ